MGGEQDGAALLHHELGEHVHHLAAGQGIQPTGGLIEDEQLGIVGQGHRHLQAHAHASAEFLDLLGGIEARGLELGVVALLGPGGEETPDAAAQVLQAPFGVVGRGIEDDADALMAHGGG